MPWEKVEAKIKEGMVGTAYERYHDWFVNCGGLSSGDEYTPSTKRSIWRSVGDGQ